MPAGILEYLDVILVFMHQQQWHTRQVDRFYIRRISHVTSETYTGPRIE